MPQVQNLSGKKHIFENKKMYIKAMEHGVIDVGDEVIILDDGAPQLPDVSEVDEGKFLQVKDGKWTAEKLPIYEEEYSVTPSATPQTLPTAGKTMTDNLTVEEIPYYEVSNDEGGTTVNIG